MRLKQLEGKGVAGTVWHHMKQIAKTAANEIHKDISLPIHQSKFTLDRKTVVVVDEAGMVGTKDMAKLLAHTREAGAKLVLVGDSRQLQPIAAGAPFARIEKDQGAARLTHITRQALDKDDHLPHWRREAVSLFAAGRAKEALPLFAERGFLKVEDDRDKARRELVADWVQHGGAKDPKGTLILAGTNQDVRSLNALCQAERLKASNAPKGPSVEVDGETIGQGDRVLFTKKSRTLEVDNGDLGTVGRVSGWGKWKTVSVEIDSGLKIDVPLNDYQDIRLGYAMTTHKAQGSTVKNSFVLLGGSMQDLHLSYVQASRAVETTRFYSDRFETDVKLDQLAKTMSQLRAKEMAHDVMRGRPDSEDERARNLSRRGHM